jgi:uncharacterized protein (UPF0548 family)
VAKPAKVERPSGPELRLVGVKSGARSEGYVSTVTAIFGETSNTELSMAVTVIEVSKEMANVHTLDYGTLAGEVVECLKGLNLSDDTMNETVDLTIGALRKEASDISK